MQALLAGTTPAQISLVYFYAAFHEACKPGGPMDAVLEALKGKYPALTIYRFDAETLTEDDDPFDIQAVPTCVVLQGSRMLGKVEGFEPAKLSDLLAHLPKPSAPGPAGHAEALARSARVFLFSSATDAALYAPLLAAKPHGSFELAGDAELSRHFANKSALFVDGKLVADFLTMAESKRDELLKPPPSGLFAQEKRPKPTSLDERLKALVSQEPIMLFMKGTPAQPRCGFSAKMVALLNDQGVKFGSFDILQDEEVRAGLKKLFEWPTYPQLYSKGRLVGGLDICNELVEEGELLKELGVE